MEIKEGLVNFFVEINKLKNSKRFSTSKKPIAGSSTEHSWKVALMVIMISEKLNLKLDIKNVPKWH